MKSAKNNNHHFPCYQGEKWIQAKLPSKGKPWLLGKYKPVGKDGCKNDNPSNELGVLLQQKLWAWPKWPIFFFRFTGQQCIKKHS